MEAEKKIFPFPESNSVNGRVSNLKMEHRKFFVLVSKVGYKVLIVV
jgi:hypothetical protein